MACPLLPLGIRYNATMDERRYTPRAHLDEGGDRYTNRAALLSSSQEHCERINFHVLVSQMPSSPTHRAQASPGRGRSWARCCRGRGRELSWCQAGSEPPADLRRPGRGQCPGPWPSHTHAPEQRPLGHTTSHLTVPSSEISSLPALRCPPFLKQGVKFKEGGGLNDV